MPGLGVRNFGTEVLTSANVNGYLMQQSVMVFADAATRTAQFAAQGVTASAGMLSYRTDIGSLEIYTGATWRPIAVTSAAAAANAYTGTPVQIGRYTWTNETSLNAASWTNATNGSYTFTPKYATSRLEVVAELAMAPYYPGGGYAGMACRILRDGTVLTQQNQTHQVYTSSSTDLYTRTVMSWVGAATTATAQVFNIQVAAYASTSAARLNQGAQWESHITITEWSA